MATLNVLKTQPEASALRALGRAGRWIAALMGVAASLAASLALAITTNPLQGIDAITTGSNHTCARTTSGGLKCWGNGFNGQIGDNGDISKCPNGFTCADVYSRRYPVDVPEQATGIGKVVAGTSHTCALAADGTVRCWGINTQGQLGIGSSTAEFNAPELVTGITTAADVSAGFDHACVALASTGAVKCWGANGGYQLGDGTNTDNRSPVAVNGLTGTFKAVAAGNYHTCALASAGDKVMCWGTNNAGQAGANASQYYATPTNVIGLPASGIQAIASGGFHSCALAAGKVYCWGENKKGQLGVPFPTADYFFNAAAMAVPGISSATAIVAGSEHTCAIDAGAMKCWGAGANGNLGNGGTTDSVTPVVVTGLGSGVTAISRHCGVLGAGGTVKCWGSGIIGDGLDSTAGTRTTPVDVIVPTDDTANAFSFSPSSVAGVQVVSGQQSPLASVSGFDHVALVTITNGEYSQQCSGPFTSRPGNLPIGSGICVRHTASATPGASVTTTVTVGGQSATFSSTTATAGSGNPPRLGNISTRGPVLTGNDVMIGGVIIGGSTPKKVLITARGPSLASFGIANPLANPKIDLFSGQTLIASNDNWQQNSPSDVAAITALGIFPNGLAPADPNEAALLMTLNPGAYTAVVSGVNGGTGVGIVEVFEQGNLEIPLINISTRGQVQTGTSVMIGGFVIQGSASRTVMITARGPSLAAFGITNPLANPKIELYQGQSKILENDDWETQGITAGGAAAVTEIRNSGIAPTNTKEAALYVTLVPGAYTVVVSGADGGTGVGIVEVFAR